MSVLNLPRPAWMTEDLVLLEEQARRYVRQAYAAIFPYAQQLCAFEAADKQREQDLDKELPGSPAPL